MSEEASLDEFAGDASETAETDVAPPTELTDTTDDWDQISLEEVATSDEGAFVDGPFGSNLKADEMSGQGYARIIQLQNIRPSEFINTNHKYVSKEKFFELKRHGAQPGDVAIAKMSEPVARACLLPDIENQYLVVADCIKLTVDESKYNSAFVMLSLNSEPVWKQAFARSRGSTRKRINLTQLKEVQIPTPPLPEQRKIATVLHTVDRAIEKTEEIVSQQRRVKRGLYQYLFSKGYKNYSDFRSSKYGDIPKSWGISKLSEVTSQIQAGGTPNTDVSEYYDGDIPWVKTGELSQYRVTEAEESITQKGYEESTARLFSPGTVLIAMYGATTGEVSLLGIEATTNQACCGVVTTEEIDSEFLFHQLNHFSNRLESLSAGSGQQNISKGIIKKFDVLVPPAEEQASIVEVLSSVDRSIKENQVVNSHYKRLKRGLMQDLLSGEVRTTDKSIQVPDEISKHG